MSMDAKLALMKDLEAALQDDLTVSAMRRLSDAMSSVLNGYSVEQVRQEQADDTDDMLEAFLKAKMVEGLAEKTLKQYRRTLKKLIRSAGMPLGKIGVENIRTYLAAEKDRGISDRSLHGDRDVFSSCFGWLHREGMIIRNPCGNVNSIKYAEKVRVPFSESDIEKMKEACTCIRDKAIIAFLLSSGARISEVCALNRDDIDFREMECIVMGKGSKERTVYIDDVAGMLLSRYFAGRKDNEEALFVGKANERLTDGGIRRMLKRIEEVSGVENVHPHRFRRTLATTMINRGMPIEMVARILGHSRIDTTMTYIYVEKNNVKNNYRKYA